jgi:hypothetical protein
MVMLAAMLVFSAIAFGQNETKSFAGTWNLDIEKSELGERSRIKSMTMTVTQSETELSYERKVERKEGGGGRRGMGRGGGANLPTTFDLSGKETAAPGGGRGTAKLKAESKNGILKLMRTVDFEGRMGQVTVKNTETWSVSEDGKTLTIAAESENPRGTRSSKMVFTLASE